MKAERAYVTGLEAAHEDCGGKAAGLARMLAKGFPVPPGFCVTEEAYRRHLESAGVTALKDADSPDEDARGSIQSKILAAPLADTLREEIRKFYDVLGAASIAVRSSATREDLPEHSFAGLYDSYIELSSPESCFDAVKKCWASFWSSRACAYRREQGFSHLDSAMAVIVQKFVAGEISGVVFTATPDGDAETLIIEACHGTGQGLVSGRILPERIRVRRDTLAVVERSTGTPRGDWPAETLLDEEGARRVAELALAVESLFGTPQDIEWTRSNGTVFLLQCRPITTLKEKEDRRRRPLWSNANVGEVLPDVASPMTWSMSRKFIGLLLNVFLERLGISLGDVSVLGLVAGRVYFSMNILLGILRKLPLIGHIDISRILGGHRGKTAPDRIEIFPEDIADLNIRPLTVLLKTPGFVLWLLFNSPAKGKGLVEDFKKNAESMCLDETASRTVEELAAHAARYLDHLMESKDIIACIASGMMHFQLLEKLCRKWLHDDEGDIFGRLLASLGSIESAEPGLRLWEMASFARSHGELGDLLMTAESFESLKGKCPRCQGGTEFISRWDLFMQEHGHHCRGEIDVFNRRWSETPDYILGMARNYLRDSAGTDLLAGYRAQSLERERLTAQVLRSLRNPLKRWIFSSVLHQAQEGLSLRECMKSEMIRQVAVVRCILQELGASLTTRGTIAEREDIFFLELEELEAVSKEAQDFNVREIIGARKAEYERNLRLKPPSVIIGEFNPDNYVPETPDASLDTLKGLSVSPGKTAGKARVLGRESERESVLPGEILVIPFADPGWTPYFVPAAGIVMDLGGMLSHGCIIAREYGIPTVANVGPATEIIRTGDTVEVDGTGGIVRILERAG